jgi:hypothetical protein
LTLQVSQTVVTTGITPAQLTPAASDTIAATSFGPQGVVMRITTTTTAANVAVQDPGVTAQGNPGTVTAIALGTAVTRTLLVPVSAINPATGQATVTFSATSGVTYELYRY